MGMWINVHKNFRRKKLLNQGMYQIVMLNQPYTNQMVAIVIMFPSLL